MGGGSFYNPFIDNKDEFEDIKVDINDKSKIKSFLGRSFNDKFNNLKIKYKKDPKKKLVLVIAILGLFSMFVGTSYAYLTYISKTENSTVIKAGTLALNFKNESNAITLNNAFPEDDRTGLSNSSEYEFTIGNTGSIGATYKITLDNTCTVGKSYILENTSIIADKCIPNEYIKIGLKEEGESSYKVLEKKIINEENSYVIDADSLNASEEKTYKMKIWLDYNTPNTYNSKGGLNVIYSGKLGLSYEQGVKNLDKSGANVPELSKSMVPVYYDETKETWNKADSLNSDEKYKWYDYDNKMWANSITYDHTKVYDESNNRKGKSFNGIDNYEEVGNANYDFKKNIILATRFKVSGDTGTYQDIISNHEGGGAKISISTKKNITFEIYATTAKEYKVVQSTITIEYDKWYTVVGTYDGSTMKLYIDGKLNNSLAITDTIKASPLQYLIGANPQASSQTAFFKGVITYALVAKNTMNASDIENNWNTDIAYKADSNALAYKDYSIKHKNATLNEATYKNDGVTFDGINDYIDAGYASYDFGKTITMAVKFKISGDTGENRLLLNNVDSAGFSLAVNTSDRIRFVIRGETLGVYKGIDSTITVEKDKWYTVVGTYDGDSLKLYINGELNNSLALTDTIKISPVPITLGANPDKNNTYREFFPGIISNAVVHDELLSEEEILTNYNSKIFNSDFYTDNTLFSYDLRGYEGRKLGEEVPMDMISTMQVWIPRYKYKVWNYNSDGTKTSEPQEIDIQFEEGKSSTGDITCTDTISGTDGAKSESCKINEVECTDSTCNGKYYTHPAFTFGEKELSGIWVGKFELTGEIDNITTKPNSTSLRNQNISTFETNIMKMNDTSNKYGFSTNDDTHMIKNTEWGSVAYLSHSKYGINKEIALNSNSNFITGCGPQSEGSTSSGTICNSYNTSLGKSASTTGNVYGIYDMSGGAYDYVMGNIVSPDGTTMLSGKDNISNSGYTGKIYDSGNYTSYTGAYSYPNVKYYDKYSFGTSNNQRIRTKLGDAIKEVGITNTTNWYEDYGFILHFNYSWIPRGGSYNREFNSGIFNSGNGVGDAYPNNSSRLVISR